MFNQYQTRPAFNGVEYVLQSPGQRLTLLNCGEWLLENRKCELNDRITASRAALILAQQGVLKGTR